MIVAIGEEWEDLLHIVFSAGERLTHEALIDGLDHLISTFLSLIGTFLLLHAYACLFQIEHDTTSLQLYAERLLLLLQELEFLFGSFTFRFQTATVLTGVITQQRPDCSDIGRGVALRRRTS